MTAERPESVSRRTRRRPMLLLWRNVRAGLNPATTQPARTAPPCGPRIPRQRLPGCPFCRQVYLCAGPVCVIPVLSWPQLAGKFGQDGHPVAAHRIPPRIETHSEHIGAARHSGAGWRPLAAALQEFFHRWPWRSALPAPGTKHRAARYRRRTYTSILPRGPMNHDPSQPVIPTISAVRKADQKPPQI